MTERAGRIGRPQETCLETITTGPKSHDDRSSLRGRYVKEWLVLALCVAAMAVFLVWSWQQERASIEQMERERLQTQARVVGENITRQLQAVDAALRGAVARYPEWLKQPNPLHHIQDHLQTLGPAMPGVRLVIYIDGKGIGRAFSDTRLAVASEWDVSSRPYYLSVVRAPDPQRLYVSEPFEALMGGWAVVLSRVIPGTQGEIAGVVSAVVSTEEFRVLLNSVRYAPDMWVALAHGAGRQFMMEPDRPGLAGVNLAKPGSLFLRHQESGRPDNVFEGVTLSTGEQRLSALRTVDLSDLKADHSLLVAVTRDLGTTFASTNALFRTYLTVFAFTLLAAIVSLALVQRLRWQALQKIARQNDNLDRFFQLNLDLFAIVSKHGQQGRFNDAWASILGYGRSELTQVLDQSAVHPEDLDRTKAVSQRLFDGQPVNGFSNRLRHADGSYREIEWCGVSSDEQVFLSGRDVTQERANQRRIHELNRQLEEQRTQLEQMAFQDGLTGVHNRRHFDQALLAEWRACQRERRPLAVLLMDIDAFKRYNDTQGHQQGDECLRLVAAEIKTLSQRPRDLVARYGGEEFVVLLPDTDANGALAKARQVVDAVAALRIRHDASPVEPYVTLSVGVAVAVPGTDTLPELLVQHADAALYRAKAQGRNQAVLSGTVPLAA